MTKFYIFIILVLVIFVLIVLLKTKNKEIQNLKDDYIKAVEYGNKISKAYEEASRKKETLNTGNNSNDFANSVNILHEYSKKRSKD